MTNWLSMEASHLPSDLIWRMFSMKYMLIYTEYFTLIISLLVIILAFYSGLKLFQRSVARALTINFFREYPGIIVDAFATSKLSEEIAGLLSNLDKIVASPTADAEKTFAIQATSLRVVISAVESKIQRNLFLFNDFGGPIYPSHGLSDRDIVKYFTSWSD